MIHIACSADDYYIAHCGTMLVSLFENNPEETFHIHFLLKHLAEDNSARLRQLVESYGADLTFHQIEDSAVSDFPTEKFHPSCWYRVLLPELLADLPRMLYLDADMLVFDSIKPLWNMDLAGKMFAAVVNPLYPFMPNRVRDDLKLAATEYLNSGVLLMNLKKMRDESLTEKLRQYAKQHPENLWPEQDALSVTVKGDWLSIAPRWNAQSTLFDLSLRRLPFRSEEVFEARKKPAIVHFIGPHKPWHYLCRHVYRKHYHEYRALTPWGACELEGRTKQNIVLRPFSLGVQLKMRAVARRMRSIIT